MLQIDAIEILKYIQGSLEETRIIERCAIDMAIEALKEDRPQWIPCSERLPKDCEIVLASFKTGVVQMCKYFDSGRDDSWWSYKDDCFAWDNTVVAWMPLPTPYKEEGDEK